MTVLMVCVKKFVRAPAATFNATITQEMRSCLGVQVIASPLMHLGSPRLLDGHG